MVPDLKYIYINTYICTCKYPACVDIKTTDGLVGLQHPAKYKIVFVKGIVHGNQVHPPPSGLHPCFLSIFQGLFKGIILRYGDQIKALLSIFDFSETPTLPFVHLPPTLSSGVPPSHLG